MKPTRLQDLLRAVAVAIGHCVRKRANVGRAVISRLRESLSVRRGQTSPYHELDSLAGSWAREEADAFDFALREQRTVDPNAWQ